MVMEYTEEQLNNFDKATIVQLFLVQQSQLQDIDRKLQLLLEQVAVLNNNRFGKSSEKLDTENQICFMEVDGNNVFFNETETVASLKNTLMKMKPGQEAENQRQTGKRYPGAPCKSGGTQDVRRRTHCRVW